MIDRINVQLIINGIPLIIVSLSEMSLFAEPKECLKVSYMIFAYYKINHDEFINVDVVNRFIYLVNLTNIKEPDTFKNIYKSAQELFGLFKLKTLMGLKSKYEDRDYKSPYLLDRLETISQIIDKLLLKWIRSVSHPQPQKLEQRKIFKPRLIEQSNNKTDALKLWCRKIAIKYNLDIADELNMKFDEDITVIYSKFRYPTKNQPKMIDTVFIHYKQESRYIDLNDSDQIKALFDMTKSIILNKGRIYAYCRVNKIPSLDIIRLIRDNLNTPDADVEACYLSQFAVLTYDELNEMLTWNIDSILKSHIINRMLLLKHGN